MDTVSHCCDATHSEYIVLKKRPITDHASMHDHTWPLNVSPNQGATALYLYRRCLVYTEGNLVGKMTLPFQAGLACATGFVLACMFLAHTKH